MGAVKQQKAFRGAELAAVTVLLALMALMALMAAAMVTRTRNQLA